MKRSEASEVITRLTLQLKSQNDSLKKMVESNNYVLEKYEKIAKDIYKKEMEDDDARESMAVEIEKEILQEYKKRNGSSKEDFLHMSYSADVPKKKGKYVSILKDKIKISKKHEGSLGIIFLNDDCDYKSSVYKNPTWMDACIEFEKSIRNHDIDHVFLEGLGYKETCTVDGNKVLIYEFHTGS